MRLSAHVVVDLFKVYLKAIAPLSDIRRISSGKQTGHVMAIQRRMRFPSESRRLATVGTNVILPVSETQGKITDRLHHRQQTDSGELMMDLLHLDTFAK